MAIRVHSYAQQAITQDQLETIPVGARIRDQVATQVGLDTDAWGITIRGEDATTIGFNMDGVTAADNRHQRAYTSFSKTAVKQVQVLTGGFNAEYGNIRAGVVNFVTKEPSRFFSSAEGTYNPAGKKHFGPNFYSEENWWDVGRFQSMSSTEDRNGDGAPDFIGWNQELENRTAGGKQWLSGVMGLGQIGGRMAQWCSALGSRVLGYDPFISRDRLVELGVEGVEMDALVDESEIVVVTIPPTPSAEKILSRERIYRLRKGALVVITTRAHAVDMEALRERIIANELAGAFDVYDREPVPEDDPLRNRINVVHTPHIAGRTRDANLRVAEVMAGDIGRVLNGEAPHARSLREAIAVRGERTDLPAMIS